MTEQEKLELAEELMDLDEGTLAFDMLLEDIEEWDSLSALSLTVEARKRWGKTVTTQMLESLETVKDLCDLFEE